MKDFLPSRWRGLVLTSSATSLEFLGTENLGLILNEWQELKNHTELVLPHLKSEKQKTYYDFCQNTINRAETCIPKIEEAIKNSEWKPVLIRERPIGYFSDGEYIYIYAQDDDFPQLRGDRYKRARVNYADELFVHAYMRLRGGSFFDIGGPMFSATFLKKSEIIYLQNHDDYREFWLKNDPGDLDDKAFMSRCITQTKIRSKPC